jgi:hypothetical protein
MRTVVGFAIFLSVSASTVLLADNWPNWRGPTHDGVSTEKGLPDKWSAVCAAAPTPGEAARSSV